MWITCLIKSQRRLEIMTTKYSDDDTYFSFLDYDSFVTELGLKEDRDDRGLVRNLIERANRRVTLELKPYIGEYDFTGSSLYRDAVNAAHTYARALFNRDWNHIHESYHDYKEDFDDQIQILIKAIISDRPGRTKTLVFSTDPQNDRLVLPSQKFDEIF